MSDAWTQYVRSFGTPDRTSATLDERASLRELFGVAADIADAEQAHMAEEVRLAEARFVEGGMGEGMATPHCAFDDTETAVICEAARLDTLEAGELLEQEFGNGPRLGLAREAVYRMRTGGTMLMTESAIQAYDPPVRVVEHAGGQVLHSKGTW